MRAREDQLFHSLYRDSYDNRVWERDKVVVGNDSIRRNKTAIN
jgi:hypothetical protein